MTESRPASSGKEDLWPRLRRKLALYVPENNRIERIWLLAKTEFRQRYYDSFLGLIWAVLNPLAQLIIYYYIFTVVFKTTIEKFALFVILGLVIYLFFQEATQKSVMLLKSKQYLLENIQINTLDIYYASILTNFLGFVFNLAVFFLISFFFSFQVYWEILLVPLLFFNLIIFILACQIILSVVHIFVRDITHVWDLVVFVLFWVSGILFQMSPDATWKTAILAYLTPLFGIIDNARAALIYGEGWSWILFVFDYAYAIILLVIALRMKKKYFGMALERM